jgi:hypothetical protein
MRVSKQTECVSAVALGEDWDALTIEVAFSAL